MTEAAAATPVPARPLDSGDTTAAALGDPRSAGNGAERAPAPCAMVIFGASGDLTKRKLVPALYALQCGNLLPTGFAVIGAGRTRMSHAEFQEAMRAAVMEYSRVPLRDGSWATFAEGVRYAHIDLDAEDGLDELKRVLAEVDASRGTAGNRVYYLSVPPSAIEVYVERLGRAGLAAQPENGHIRLIVEKPFGRNRRTGRELNAALHRTFAEEQIYRIDHYLGKETVQNLLVFRFGNGIFEPIWNRQYIDHVQVTVAESMGVEGRAAFYEEAGALRDIVQNHIMQLVSVVGMEAPADFDPETIRDEKVKFLRAVRPMHPDDALTYTVRGQYGPGRVDGQRMPGYRQEKDVDPRSLRETFVAMRLDVDNWRWAGTPFYVRTGKRLPRRATEIAIQFRRVPHSPFLGHRATPRDGQRVEGGIAPNLLILRIQPDEGITLGFNAKEPGQVQRIRSVNMDFLYGSAFINESPEAYERLIHDCLLGDATLFAREDEVDEAWRICDAVLDGWRAHPPDDVDCPNYEAGSWGPQESHDFMARDGRAWRRL